VGDGYRPPLHLVRVEGREEGDYLFDDLLDAEAFAEAVRRHGGEAKLTTNRLHDHRAAHRLIDAERER
jgi:2-keto-3-deoxy-galactonokinase